MLNQNIIMARRCLRDAFVVSAVLAGLLFAATHARADTADAIGWAASGMGRQEVAHAPRHAHVSRSTMRRIARHESRGGSGAHMLAGVYGPLAAKARQIVSACGSVVISGVRHTRVAGSHRWSEHATGHAVDIRGNPACIYAHLRGWPGGYSTDYGRVLHTHISLGGREDGLRFAHHHVRSNTRYARR